MMNRLLITRLSLLLLMLLLHACSEGNSTSSSGDNATQGYVTGENRYTTAIDGDEREYYVHVPSSYDASQAVPLVFMLHGTSGDGKRFYDKSGWTQVGDSENILTVFPSSWRYCIIEDGNISNTTKWNIYPGSFEYCANETPRDDVRFLRQVLIELEQRFNIDSKKVYLAGFSNGGQMAGRATIEMSDVLAAVVQAAGSLPRNKTYTPKRNLPTMLQLGNRDAFYLTAGATEIPMTSFDDLQNNAFRTLIQTYLDSFGLDASYSITGSEDSSLTATYLPGAPAPGSQHRFLFTLVKDLTHLYPTGFDGPGNAVHPLEAAQVHWQWMKQFGLP